MQTVRKPAAWQAAAALLLLLATAVDAASYGNYGTRRLQAYGVYGDSGRRLMDAYGAYGLRRLSEASEGEFVSGGARRLFGGDWDTVPLPLHLTSMYSDLASGRRALLASYGSYGDSAGMRRLTAYGSYGETGRRLQQLSVSGYGNYGDSGMRRLQAYGVYGA